MVPVTMHAQKEMNWWFFGDYSGLNFSETQDVKDSKGNIVYNVPTPIIGPFETWEGSFTLSDKQGNLLMSSEGMTVFDKTNTVMTNGTDLAGHRSATQSGIVVPAPGDPNKYYVISVSAEEGPYTGVRYSVVHLNVEDLSDMGYVDADLKNKVLIDGYGAENVSTIPHENGKDHWLLHRTGESFYVWLLTEDGFSQTPKAFETPKLNEYKGLNGGFVGELIVSVDNSKIVNFVSQVGGILSADFDNATGVISDIRLKSNMGYVYAGSFSPNGEYLYVGNSNIANAYVIKYEDLRTGNIKFGVLPPAVNYKLGPDERMYGINFPGNSDLKLLYVIEDPNNGDTEVRTIPKYLHRNSSYGLPNFGSSFFTRAKVLPFSCAGYDANLSIKISATGFNIPTKLVWDFGDGSPTFEQAYIDGIDTYDVVHHFRNSGDVTITVTPFKDNVELKPVSVKTSIYDCNIKSNPMIRNELLSGKELQVK